MGKKVYFTDWRVDAEPFLPGYYTDDERRAECNRLAGLIRQNFDVRSAVVAVTTVALCEFCGNDWEEDPITKEPQCCERAVKEYLETSQCPGL